jgi:alpha-1,6-mannosyl-glycoprotein beta-1,2-N-acetylglucosaminyltransferase
MTVQGTHQEKCTVIMVWSVKCLAQLAAFVHRAKRSGCNNADHPDQYGHYREAKFTMTKHHWWWKAHHIFDHMRLTHNFQGYVVFLEEDHYLAPDFVYMVNKMAESKPKYSKTSHSLGSMKQCLIWLGSVQSVIL